MPKKKKKVEKSAGQDSLSQPSPPCLAASVLDLWRCAIPAGAVGTCLGTLAAGARGCCCPPVRLGGDGASLLCPGSVPRSGDVLKPGPNLRNLGGGRGWFLRDPDPISPSDISDCCVGGSASFWVPQQKMVYSKNHVAPPKRRLGCPFPFRLGDSMSVNGPNTYTAFLRPLKQHLIAWERFFFQPKR